jgi:hypothetical protein
MTYFMKDDDICSLLKMLMTAQGIEFTTEGFSKQVGDPIREVMTAECWVKIYVP